MKVVDEGAFAGRAKEVIPARGKGSKCVVSSEVRQRALCLLSEDALGTGSRSHPRATPLSLSIFLPRSLVLSHGGGEQRDIPRLRLLRSCCSGPWGGGGRGHSQAQWTTHTPHQQPGGSSDPEVGAAACAPQGSCAGAGKGPRVSW